LRLDRRRMGAIIRKDLREYRRNRSVVSAMAIIPLIFMVQPLVSVFDTSSAAARQLGQHHELLYMLAIPALVPITLAAYTVVGERQQGTLEPLLTTPISREEFLLAKALAALGPTIGVAYLVYAAFIAAVELFAHAGVASALVRGSDVLAQVIFTPLIASAAIWVAIAISTWVSDIRVAQQLSALASAPAIVLTLLIAFDVIHPTLGLAIGLGGALILANRVGWRVVSAMFDRERLIAGR